MLLGDTTREKAAAALARADGRVREALKWL
jgi:hypothetical protein